RLALVHAADDPDLGEMVVRQLPLLEGARDDADDLTATLEDGVRDGTHHADAGATVDQPDPALGEQAAKLAGSYHVLGAGTRPGAAEDTDPPDTSIVRSRHLTPLDGNCRGSRRARRQHWLVR